jgi:hypothetical protein
MVSCFILGLRRSTESIILRTDGTGQIHAQKNLPKTIKAMAAIMKKTAPRGMNVLSASIDSNQPRGQMETI